MKNFHHKKNIFNSLYKKRKIRIPHVTESDTNSETLFLHLKEYNAILKNNRETNIGQKW